MDIKAIEMMRINNKMMLKEEPVAQTTTASQSPVTNPEAGMKALEIQAMNNVAFQGLNMKTLAKPAARAMVALALLGAAASTTSCVNYMKQEMDVDMSAIYNKMDKIIELLEKANANDEELKTLLQELGGDMETLIAYVKATNGDLGKLFILLGEIKGGQDELLKEFAGSNEELKGYLANIWASQERGNQISEGNQELLKLVLANQQKYGDKNDANSKEMIRIATEIAAKLDASIANDKEMNDVKIAFYKEMLASMKSLDATMVTGFSKLYEMAEKGLIRMEEITVLMQDTNDLIVLYGEQGEEFAKQFLQYVAALGFDMNMRTSEILAAVKEGNLGIKDAVALLAENNELLKQSNEIAIANGEQGAKFHEEMKMYVAAVGFDMNMRASEILAAVKDGKLSLDKAVELLEINNALIERSNEIAEANGEQGKVFHETVLQYIAALGFDMNMRASEILEAVEKGNLKLDSAIELLNNLNKLIENGTDNEPMDLTEIKDMLKDLIDINKANGGKLDNMIMQNDVIIGVLNTFKAVVADKLDGLAGDAKAHHQEVMDKLNELIEDLANGKCDCDMDFGALMDKLQEMSDKIGNIECTCDCDHSTPGTNEGVNKPGDLNDRLDDILGGNN